MKRVCWCFMTVILVIATFLIVVPTDIQAATITYIYDDAGRLTGVSYGEDRGMRYTYDPAGNLLSYNSFLYGDIDMNGELQLTDAILILRLLSSGQGDVTSDAGDVNNDRRIGYQEALYILQKVGDIR